MQKITNKIKAFKIIALILDTIVLLYFSLYVYWMFGIFRYRYKSVITAVLNYKSNDYRRLLSGGGHVGSFNGI